MDENLRAADRDRDEVVEVLREQYALGRLTMEEFDERSTAAGSARTMGDLRVLTVDLPVNPPGVRAPEAREAAWSPARMRLVAVAGVVAAAIIVAGVVFAGRVIFALPVWLIVLVVVRRARGGRRIRRGEGL